MIIYETERIDSLGDKLVNNSIAMICDIKSVKCVTSDDVKLSTAALVDRPTQKDLYYLNSILVSAGWNKNDDVFDVQDLWDARDTPVDKPFNYMHDDSDIIGHMIASVPLSEDGNVVEGELPERMDLATAAVIYKTWSDPEQSSRIAGLIDQIEQDKLAVSMECVFNNFDYAIISPDGEHRVIARNEDSSFLTKHLRAYGGSGDYQGYKVGRLLRNLCFSGKGLVDKPANPRSVILKTDPFKPVSLAMEVLMPDDNQLSLAQTKAQELETALAAEKSKTTTLASEVDSHKVTIQSLEAKVVELENTIAAVSQEKLTLSQELQKIVAEAKTIARKTSLINAGATEEKANELISKFAEATDEMFETVVALIVKPSAPQPENTESVESSDTSETEALETVVVEAPAITVTEEVNDKINVAAAFLRDSVLKSTKKKGA